MEPDTIAGAIQDVELQLEKYKAEGQQPPYVLRVKRAFGKEVADYFRNLDSVKSAEYNAGSDFITIVI